MNAQRILAIVALLFTAAAVQAGSVERCCNCGSLEPPRPICRVVPDVQLVTTYEYFSRQEMFCLPGRSRCLLADASPECGEPTTDCGPSPRPKIWIPTAGPVVCRSKLCRRPVTVKKQGFKYIVEDVCCGCGHAQINRASTEALQYARGLPPGNWQPLDERPSLVARPKGVKNQNVAQLATPGAILPGVALPGATTPGSVNPGNVIPGTPAAGAATPNIQLTTGYQPITTSR